LKKRNPISFLEDSFLFIKEYLEEELNTTKVFFEANFVQELKTETTAILSICETLNQDKVVVEKLNSLANTNNSNVLLFKTKHFFLSDIISIYNQHLDKENEKSRFVLAYYFDVLKNNHFADEKAISTLNKLAGNQDFKTNLDKIRKENSLNAKNQSFLITALSQNKNAKLDETLNAFEKFGLHAFNLKFDKTATNQIIEKSKEAENSSVNAIPENDTLDKVLAELNAFVGLEKVKQDVKELINLLEIQKKRDSEGLKNIEITLHTVFLGPPGTGKTSVARLLGRIFKHLGFLSKGQIYETDREGMVAGYVGQTATKVDKVVDESIGGVLFIDEAYSLTQNALGNDFGSEAINILIKRMEDYRDDLSVIVAGYSDPMKNFIESNPGLRSRFNRYFHFEHFKPAELYQIFETMSKKADFLISDDAKEKLQDTFNLLFEKKDDSFGNARAVRNLFEKCVQNQANRIVKLPQITSEILKTLTEEDVPEPKEALKQFSL
jgi:stage V sporulation protein K